MAPLMPCLEPGAVRAVCLVGFCEQPDVPSDQPGLVDSGNAVNGRICLRSFMNPSDCF